MIEVDGLITLFLNPFSPRRVAFSASRIAQIVSPSVFDVASAENAGAFYVADASAPRHSDEALLEPLRAKYPADAIVEFARTCAATETTTIDGSRRPVRHQD